MDTRGNQVSDLDDIELHWEKYNLEVGAVFRPGIETPVSPTAYDALEIGGSAKTTFCSTTMRTRRIVLQEHQTLRNH